MFFKILIVSGLLAVVALGEENIDKLISEVENAKGCSIDAAYSLVFAGNPKNLLDPRLTAAHLRKLDKLYDEALSKKERLTRAQYGQKELVKDVVNMFSLKPENCGRINPMKIKRAVEHMREPTNFAIYVNYYTDKYIELCKSIGIELSD